jgi:hypothetical protein
MPTVTPLRTRPAINIPRPLHATWREVPMSQKTQEYRRASRRPNLSEMGPAMIEPTTEPAARADPIAPCEMPAGLSKYFLHAVSILQGYFAPAGSSIRGKVIRAEEVVRYYNLDTRRIVYIAASRRLVVAQHPYYFPSYGTTSSPYSQVLRSSNNGTHGRNVKTEQHPTHGSNDC